MDGLERPELDELDDSLGDGNDDRETDDDGDIERDISADEEIDGDFIEETLARVVTVASEEIVPFITDIEGLLVVVRVASGEVEIAGEFVFERDTNDDRVSDGAVVDETLARREGDDEAVFESIAVLELLRVIEGDPEDEREIPGETDPERVTEGDGVPDDDLVPEILGRNERDVDDVLEPSKAVVEGLREGDDDPDDERDTAGELEPVREPKGDGDIVIAVVPLAVFWRRNEGVTDTDGVSEGDALPDVDTDVDRIIEAVTFALVEETVVLTITVRDCVMRAVSEVLPNDVIDGVVTVENDGVKRDDVLCVLDTDTDADTIKEVVIVTLTVNEGGSLEEGETLLLVVSETVADISEELDVVTETDAVVKRESDAIAVVDIITESLGITEGEVKTEGETKSVEDIIPVGDIIFVSEATLVEESDTDSVGDTDDDAVTVEACDGVIVFDAELDTLRETLVGGENEIDPLVLFDKSGDDDNDGD